MNSVTVCMILGLATIINGHGYIQEPPSRNSMWRFGFNNPKNYNDNEQFCGGRRVMIKNGGKCGVCGDPYHVKEQTHADGGRFANGIIVKNYRRGQVIDVNVLLTTSHKGYFEFRIGDFTNKKTAGDSIGKLKGHLLQLTSGGTKFIIEKYGRRVYKMQLKLPRSLRCKRCVLQWWYKGGNSSGCDETGCGLGKGAQETFVNCADVSIQ